ncbi:Protein CBG01083 [Caenorhabditis briggsae]|uniref:Protein CBG01083 n=1 Tax=Caenorhabditis briggsae TaxID=6238 RepID=A8WPI6_CAEBR|nr:Protein CBG01083 [Caenorhabditis briggsae]CAP22393.1 Protein CBG01083 [Caenorhabditis briggsae]
MWSAWLIVIYTLTCLVVILFLVSIVWFIQNDRKRKRMIDESIANPQKATEV